MVLNGIVPGSSQSVEAVKMSPVFGNCKNFANFPIATTGTFGGLISDTNSPVVCGGTDTKQCFEYQKTGWKEIYPMNDNREHFTGMSGSPYKNSSHRLYVIGYTQQAEVLTSSGWEYIGPVTPNMDFVSCILIVNETSILVTGISNQVENVTAHSFVFNSVTGTWTQGPSLNNKRIACGCGLIRNISNK